MKVGAGDLHLMAFSSYEFRGSGSSESHTLLRGVHEKFPLFIHIFHPIWTKIAKDIPTNNESVTASFVKIGTVKAELHLEA
jgi:hypothetical protein